ncbi:hypothetical protein [Gottfriedia luciferensis]|uniref:hypothetical protein n=1 Tax=Gottfriedia luciferensis TaxID=178774 RepID=UPI001302848F|nr:hypothetical protein [Gottfriedia luciferensis]
MTLIGYLFWGICLVAVIFAFFMEKKIGTMPPYKTEHQVFCFRQDQVLKEMSGIGNS